MLRNFKRIFLMLCAMILMITPIEIKSASAQTTVPGANAVIVKDWAYVRDRNGNIISGRRVDIGDRIRVLSIDYNKQLANVIYPSANGPYNAWIKNCSIIKYDYQGQYHNGSTREPVYSDSTCKNQIGSLDPYEHATPLYRNGGRLYVVYNTAKGTNTKSGYVKYNGGFNKF